MANSYKMYYRSRPMASNESYKRAKEIPLKSLGIFPILCNFFEFILVNRIDDSDKRRNEFIESLSKFRPTETVFEVGKRGTKSSEATVMHKRRSQLNNLIEIVKEQRLELQSKSHYDQENLIENSKNEINDEEGLLEFQQINSKKRKSRDSGKPNLFYLR